MKKQDIYKKAIKNYIEKCAAEDKITISDIANHILFEEKHLFKKNKISINYKTVKRTIAYIFSFDYNLDYFQIEIDYIRKFGAVNKKIFKKKNIENKNHNNLIEELDLDALLLDDDDNNIDIDKNLNIIEKDFVDTDNKNACIESSKKQKDILDYNRNFEEFENNLTKIEKIIFEHKLGHEIDDIILKKISLIKNDFLKIKNSFIEIDEIFLRIENGFINEDEIFLRIENSYTEIGKSLARIENSFTEINEILGFLEKIKNK